MGDEVTAQRSTLRDIKTPQKLTPAQQAKVASEGGGVDDVVMEMQIPQWLEMLLAVSRISELTIRIAEEKAEREKETYQNPHPILFGIVGSMKFDVFVAGLIFFNAFILGVQASWPDDSADAVWNASEHLFVAVFLVEWCLRMRAFGWVWFFEWANAADTFIVFGTGIFPKWILEPLGTNVTALRILSVMRLLRLIRIVRSARHLPQCRELWILIQGLFHCARPLLWITVIALMILYVAAIFAAEIIGRQDIYADDEHVQEMFGNPMRAMFTMLQLMTLDSWGYEIARPVMEKEWGLGLFFVAFIMFAVFVFGNLVTAVVVEHVLDIVKKEALQRKQEEESQKRKNLAILKEMMVTIDSDGSGELSTEEFCAAMDNPKVQTMLGIIDIKVEDMEEVWNILDDGSGVITIKEYSNGLRRTKGLAKAKDIIDILKKLRQTGVRYNSLQSQVKSFNATVSSVEHDVERIQLDTGEALGMFQEIYHRLEAHIAKEKGEDRLHALRQAKQRELHPDEDEEEEDDEEDGGKAPQDKGGAASPKADG